ncbi:hypothetical protein GCM10023091_03400 [Ravibacter arvi]|uniref:Uncharacterized protein n=1 Tax=Ravibacter arvi TaxID=2051041 RepID=A0ABP8LMW7_9BACT
MIEHLPACISWVFGATTVATLFLFYRATKNSLPVLIGLSAWLLLQGALAYSNFYSYNPEAFPPAIVWGGLLPALIAVALPFLTARGKAFIGELPASRLTYLHMVRVPVEIVLWWLFLQGTVPELMTFQGQNFDIVAGITAPFVVFFGYTKRVMTKRLILAWNIGCLGLLLNVVIHAILSAPSPVQQLAFGQPNIAVLYFPFSWLPTFVVPVVLFAHLASIRQLLTGE